MTGLLLTTVEVAERLGLTSSAVAQAVRLGALQPAARTADDLLFSERAVAEYEQRRAEAGLTPLPQPPSGTRQEWAGELDRVAGWLQELTDSVRPPAPASEPAPAPAADAEPEAVREPVPQPSEPAPPPPEPPPPEPPPPPPEPPIIAAAVSSPPTPAVLPPASSAEPGSQLLAVQPIVRFFVLKQIRARIREVDGVLDVRLERLEGGVAWYRINHAGDTDLGEGVAGALAPLGLGVLVTRPRQEEGAP
jgi:hypothetical protein